MSDTVLSTTFSTSSYWWESAPPEAALEPLPEKTDVLIVGSGFAGLSAALELARNGIDVTVIDKDMLGFGASSRSHGMVSSGQKLVLTGAFKAADDGLVSKVLADSQASFDYLKNLVAQENLDVDLALTGRFFGAHTKGHYKRLVRNGETLAKYTGVTVHNVSKAEQVGLIGSTAYEGGILVDDYGGLHPAKLNAELRRLARAAGAKLRSHAGLISRRKTASGEEIAVTARGTLRATRILVATNGYTGAATPELQRRTVPVQAYLIASEPIPRDLMDEINPGRRMIADSKRNLFAMRPSPDGTRVIFGNRPGYFEVPERDAAPILHEKMCSIWPQLRDVKISHCWTGNVCMTYDKMPHMGNNDDLLYALGCNGNGVALMTYMGYQSARKVIEDKARICAFDDLGFPSIPLYTGKPWFVPIVGAWYGLRDKLDA